MRIQGDPDQPYRGPTPAEKSIATPTAINSPERISTPLKRSGPKELRPVHGDRLGPGAR